MKLIYFVLAVSATFFISCQKEIVDDNSQTKQLNIRNLVQDPFSLDFNNISYVYYQRYSPERRLESVHCGAYSKDNSIQSFKVNNVNIPQRLGKSNEYLDVKYGSSIPSTYRGNISLKSGNIISNLEEINVNFVDTYPTNRDLNLGKVINWETSSNYNGATIFIIKSNSISSDGTASTTIDYSYEIIDNSTSVSITQDMLDKFENGQEVTILLGIAEYEIDNNNDNLFISSSTALSATYKIVK